MPKESSENLIMVPLEQPVSIYLDAKVIEEDTVEWTMDVCRG